MDIISPLFTSFCIIFFSELGDKTQLLVLSFSTKLKISTLLLGIAIGSFFSHGIAVLFGSFLGNIQNSNIHVILEFITYFSFLLLGLLSFLPSKNKEGGNKESLLKSLCKLPINFVLLIALSIIIGELGDKTFLASIGMGIHYPTYKFFLILGAILGMVISNLLVIIFGKFLSKKIPENIIEKFSGILFILFGCIGFISFYIKFANLL